MILGSGELVRTLAEAGVIDQYVITTIRWFSEPDEIVRRNLCRS